MQWNFEGYEASVAQRLVLLIDSRLDEEWTRHDDGPGMWRWQFDDPDYVTTRCAAAGTRSSPWRCASLRSTRCKSARHGCSRRTGADGHG